MNSNDYQYSAGSYYLIQEAKQDYTDSLKHGLRRKKISVEEVGRFYLDFTFFLPNLIYFPLTGGTIFGTFGGSGSAASDEEVAGSILESEIRSLQNDSISESYNKGLSVFGDLVLAYPNIFYYLINGETIFGTFGGHQEEEVSSKSILAQNLLKNAATQKNIPPPTVEEFVFNPLDFLSLWEFSSSKTSALERKFYFTSDGLMNRFDPETFTQVITDANLVLDDLDLSAEDVEELKQNGYLDFIDSDEKSISTFETSPNKGKKKK